MDLSNRRDVESQQKSLLLPLQHMEIRLEKFLLVKSSQTKKQ